MGNQINVQNYLDLADNDWDFLYKLIQQSNAGLAEFKENYQDALETADIEKLRDAIHKIKPTLIILEANKLLELLEEAKEILTEEKQDPARTYINSALTNREVEEIIALLENYLTTAPSIQ